MAWHAKVVAGLECDRTNAALQLLALAGDASEIRATEPLHHERRAVFRPAAHARLQPASQPYAYRQRADRAD